MRALVLEGHGGHDRLSFRSDWPEPEPGPGEVVVRVGAGSLNYHDVFTRRGMPGIKVPIPVVPGLDIAGEIEALGAGVEGWSAGDRVLVDPIWPERGLMGEMLDGGLAEKALCSAGQLVPMPDGVSFAQAASLPVAYGTAHRMMFENGHVKAGETVLILGASGGVGNACVLLAKAVGAHVIAAASSQEKLDRLLALGADEGLNTSRRSSSARSGSATQALPALLRGRRRRGGQLHRRRHLGALDEGAQARRPDADLRGDRRFRPADRHPLHLDLRVADSRLQQLDRRGPEGNDGGYRRGRFDPPIDVELPLEDAAEGIRMLEDREVFGRSWSCRRSGSGAPRRRNTPPISPLSRAGEYPYDSRDRAAAFRPGFEGSPPMAGRAFRPANDPRLGIAMICLGMVVITVNDSIVKALSDRYPLHEIVFVRAIVALLFSLAVLRFEGGLRALRTGRPAAHLARGLCMVLANLAFFGALASAPLADVTALFFVAPLLITLLSIPFLGEKVGIRRFSAVLVGFLGVLVMLRPGTGELEHAPDRWTLLLPMAAALAYATMQILTRKLRRARRPQPWRPISRSCSLSSASAFSPSPATGASPRGVENKTWLFLFRAWVWPTWEHWLLFVLLGGLSGFIAYSLTQAYRLADARRWRPSNMWRSPRPSSSAGSCSTICPTIGS